MWVEVIHRGKRLPAICGEFRRVSAGITAKTTVTFAKGSATTIARTDGEVVIVGLPLAGVEKLRIAD